MTNPIAASFLALDRGVEKLGDLALESAAPAEEFAREADLSDKQRVLVALDRHQHVDASTPGLKEALESLLVEEKADGFSLTPLGRCVLPDLGDDLDGGLVDENAPPVVSSRA